MSKNEKKNRCGKLKKIQEFCPWDMESCHLGLQGAARRVKLLSLHANLFFEVHFNHIWQRKLPFKALIAILWDLQPLWSSLLTKPDLLRFKCSSRYVLSKTKLVPPSFFTFLTSITHQHLMVKFSEKSQC